MSGPATTPRAVTKELADYVVGLAYEHIPDAAITAAKEAVLDQFGVMLRGSTLPWTRPAYTLALDTGSSPQSTLVGHGERVAAIEATVVNASYGHSCAMDDHGYRVSAHPGSLSVPTALALAEWKHLSGREFLVAIVTGYEVLYRIGRVVSGPALAAGWHHQSVIGPFGAASVGIKLLGLSPAQALDAFAIAGSHASGTMEYDRSGGEVKRYHAAMAARGGLVAAMLAERGLTGPHTILEGERGIPRMFAHVEDAAGIVDDLGERTGWFAVQGRTERCFPTVGTIHTPIQAFGRLVDEHRFGAEEIERIDAWVHPLTVGHGAAVLHPHDTISAQFSLAFSLGLRLLTGANSLDGYMDPAMWDDDRILSVGRRLVVHPEPAYEGMAGQDAPFPARVRVTLADGREVEAEELYRRGSPRNPITQDERYAKFRSLAAPAIGGDRMDEILAAVEKLEQADDMATVAALLAVAGR